MAQQTVGAIDNLNVGRVKINDNFTELYGANSPRIFTTSGAGAVDDADISLGSSTFGTDNYAVLQALLDEAASGPITIIWDGHYSISTALTVRSNTKIIALDGCGVIMTDSATSAYCFLNENIVRGSATGGFGSNIVDQNIWFENMIFNGNNAGQPTTPHTAGIGFFGVRNLVIKNCRIIAPNTFAMIVHNAEFVDIHNIYVDHNATSETNHDGLHFDGYIKYLTIDGAYLKDCTDDAIALLSGGDGTNAYGPITDVFIRNVTLYNTTTGAGGGVRIGSGGAYNVEDVVIDGVTGNVNTRGLTFVVYDGSSELMRNISVSNFSVDLKNAATALIYFAGGGYRNISFNNFNIVNNLAAVPIISMIGGSLRNLNISNFNADLPTAMTVPFFSITGGTLVDLRMSNIFAFTANLSSVPFIQVGTTAELRTVQLDNVNVINFIKIVKYLSTATAPTLVQLNNCYVQNATIVVDTDVTLTSLDASNVRHAGSLIGGSGSVTNKRGSNLDYLGSLAFANLPTASLYAGSRVYVNNEADGPTMAFSNGTSWIDVRDGNAVTGP